MKKIIFLLGLMAAMIFLGMACSDEKDPVELPESKLEFKQFVSESINPNFMDNSDVRKVQIYLPAGYENNDSKSYPVVYLLHGLPFSEQSFISEELWEPWIGPLMPFVGAPDFPQEGFKAWIDGLIEIGQIEPMIIVMPDAGVNAYGFSMYTNSLLNGGFEDFIVKDLVNFIDSNYKTNDSKNGRALIGTSQGGYGALKLGMLHPDRFGVVASHTGLLYLEGVLALADVILAENPDGVLAPDPAKFLTSALFAFGAAWSPNPNNPPYMVDLPIDELGNPVPEIIEEWMKHDVFTMLDDPVYSDNFKSLGGVYFDAGLQDELGMQNMSDAVSMKLTAMGITHTYENFDGGHFSNLYSRLEISLKFCSDRMD